MLVFAFCSPSMSPFLTWAGPFFASHDWPCLGSRGSNRITWLCGSAGLGWSALDLVAHGRFATVRKGGTTLVQNQWGRENPLRPQLKSVLLSTRSSASCVLRRGLVRAGQAGWFDKVLSMQALNSLGRQARSTSGGSRRRYRERQSHPRSSRLRFHY